MMHIITLPVSGERLHFRMLNGSDELLLLEAADDDLTLALTLMSRVATHGDEATGFDGWHLTPTDVDFFLVRLRQTMLGDRIVSDIRCSSSGCQARIDVSFDIDHYLAHQVTGGHPLKGRGWTAEFTDEPGWFRVRSARNGESHRSHALFRLPTVADLRDVASHPRAAAELARRCIRSDVTPAPRRLAEVAMSALAPRLSQELQGRCPDCDASIAIEFQPRRYVLQELRDHARFVYQDVDVIAHRYHWRESDILALPLTRRMRYVDAARLEGAAA
jgi:hypothetical protein